MILHHLSLGSMLIFAPLLHNRRLDLLALFLPEQEEEEEVEGNKNNNLKMLQKRFKECFVANLK
jgi:hypothetical protein